MFRNLLLRGSRSRFLCRLNLGFGDASIGLVL